MRLRTPSSRLLLSLIGATLVLWGARNAVLRMPFLGDINLFEMNRGAAWTLTVGVAIAMFFSWLPKRLVAWTAFIAAFCSVAFLCYDILSRVQSLRAMGGPAAQLADRAVHDIEIKPGAVGVASGMIILALALSLHTTADTRRAAS